MPGASLTDAGPQLAPGGFRRLLEKGAYFPDCRHLASSFPASSIATLGTGAWPAQHGIVAGSWYDRASKKAVTASEELLLATTLASQVAAEQNSRAFVIALDSWQARLFAGSPNVQRYWMEETGAFSTLGEAPDWFANYNAQRSLDSLHDAKWQVLGAKNDAPALRILKFSSDRPRDFVALYRSSPFAQDAQFEFATELIARESLGKDTYCDFVCLLLGSTALLGYETGASSPLMQQMILRLDRRIESLLAQLTKSHGENGFNFVFAAAHGAPPLPEPEVRYRMVVNGENIAQAVDKSITVPGMGRVEKYIYPFLYLDTSGFRDPEPLRMAAARAAMQYPTVANFYTAGDSCSTHNDWERRFRNSFHPVRSGDVMLSYRPEYVEEYGQGRGISYGSLYNYDIQVPLCFYGPQFRAGVFESPVESVDLAPTLARVLGVAAPSSSVGHVLGEALAT